MSQLLHDDRYIVWFEDAFKRAGVTDQASRQKLVLPLLERLRAALADLGETPATIEQEMALARLSADHVSGGAPAVEPAPPEPAIPPIKSRMSLDVLTALLGTWPGKALALAAIIAVYLLPLGLFVREGANFRTFSATDANTGFIGITISGLDFVKDVSQLHLNLLPTGLAASDGHLPADLVLTVDAGSGPLTHTFKGGVHLTPWTITAAVEEGDILDYPFDRHAIEVTLSATMQGRPVPIAVGLQHVVHGYSGSVVRNEVEGNETEATIQIRRSGTVIFLASLITLSLLIVVGAAVSVAYQVVVRGRKPEFSMMVWTGALLFVVPSVRNSLPGNIPTGALIDFAVYFWLQLLMVAVSASLVYAWIRRTE